MAAKNAGGDRGTVRRSLDEAGAAMHLSVSCAQFCEMMARGVLPPPALVGDLRLWEVDALERARPALQIALLGLRNIDRFVDQHGKLRCYFRSGRGRRVKLPGLPGSPEFMQAYEHAAQQANRARRS